jgi:hypothetical protein
VGEAEPDVRGRVGGAGDPLVAVPPEVRVIGAGERDGAVAGLDGGTAVGGVRPAGGGELGGQLRPRQRCAEYLGLLRDEVAHRVLESRGVVVVVARHERARAAQQRLQRLEDWADGVGAGEEVAGGDHEIRLQAVEVADPGPLAPLRRRQVKVGQMQHGQRRRVRREHRYVEAAQLEEIALDEARVGQPGSGEAGGGRGGGAGLHSVTVTARG